MSYQFQVDSTAVGPVRNTWSEAVQDARDNGYPEFSVIVKIDDVVNSVGPSIIRVPLKAPVINRARTPQETEAQRETRVAPLHNPEEIKIAQEHQAHANHTVNDDEAYARKALIPNYPQSNFNWGPDFIS